MDQASDVAIRISLRGRAEARVVYRFDGSGEIEIRDPAEARGWVRMSISDARRRYLEPRPSPEPPETKRTEPDYSGPWFSFP